MPFEPLIGILMIATALIFGLLGIMFFTDED